MYGSDWIMLALDRKSTRLNSSHLVISYAVFCLTKKERHVYRPRVQAWIRQRSANRHFAPRRRNRQVAREAAGRVRKGGGHGLCNRRRRPRRCATRGRQSTASRSPTAAGATGTESI